MFDSSMDKKRPKRAKSLEDGTWDCSVCTFKNSAEAFKCAMCDVRKGTSTRKPKPNPELVAQQVAQQLPPAKREKTSGSLRRPERGEPSVETDTSQDSHRSDTTDHQEHKKSRSSTSSESRRLRNIDRRSGVSMEVTVNGVTVVVTDYKPKIPAATPSSSKSSRPSVDGHTSHDSTSSHAPLSPNLHLNQSNSSTLSFSSTTGQQNLTDGNNSDKIDSD